MSMERARPLHQSTGPATAYAVQALVIELMWQDCVPTAVRLLRREGIGLVHRTDGPRGTSPAGRGPSDAWFRSWELRTNCARTAPDRTDQCSEIGPPVSGARKDEDLRASGGTVTVQGPSACTWQFHVSRRRNQFCGGGLVGPQKMPRPSGVSGLPTLENQPGSRAGRRAQIRNRMAGSAARA